MYGQIKFVDGYIQDAYLNTLIGNYIELRAVKFRNNVMLGTNLQVYNPTYEHFVEDNVVIGKDIMLRMAYSLPSHKNVAIGSNLLSNSGIGWNNVVIGENLANELHYIGLSYNNILIGAATGQRAAGYNVYLGTNTAMYNSGNDNVAIGINAGSYTTSYNPATDYSNTVALGARSKLSGNHQVQLGNEDSTVYAQKALSIRSDERDKTDIKELQYNPLEFIMKLKPVQYRLDPRSQYTCDLFITGEQFTEFGNRR